MNDIRIVLVRPQGADNVGAAARAMKNMGLRRLVLVEPAIRRLADASAMAVHARDVLEAARIAPSLAEAVADCCLVVGTTCRDGLYRADSCPPHELAPLIVARAERAPVALVFGPEDHGLSNEDLKLCQRLITIDTDPEYASLNLAQAVLLCCYELRRACGAERPRDDLDLATSYEIELTLERLKAAFLEIGFLHRDNPDHIMFAFRRLLGRAGLEKRDARILMGVARQIEWYARQAREGGEGRG